MSEPVNAASVAIFDGGKVLLIQRAVPPFQGFWSLPGGRLEPGERPEDAARRELEEELGLVAGELIRVTDYNAGTDGRFLIAVFLAATVSGTPRLSSEVSNLCQVQPADLAGLQTTPGLGRVLNLCLDRLTAN